MNIVLVEPEIPQNTGNIARLSACTGSSLHLVEPLGFSTEDKYLKRAGLDYWDKLDIFYYSSLEEVQARYKKSNFYYTSKKAERRYTSIKYRLDDFLVFGKETEGLPESILKNNSENSVRIPMVKNVRSLNLSNAVAVMLYEALRQNHFPDFI